MELTVRARHAGSVVVVRFSGRMVLGQASSEATEWLRDLIAKNPQIVIDLDGLFFVDPSGIGALLSLYTSATAHGGKLRFARPSRKIARLLESTKLNSVFPVYETEADAIAAFAPAG
ncbi:MAG: STAS domain-containing protein [Acidobacteriia bacterium]|nr:STAS domain-containing protein [Terriglobia bacterium]